MSGAVAAQNESDEQFARRLQQQEMGTRAGGANFDRDRSYHAPHIPLLNNSSHHGARASNNEHRNQPEGSTRNNSDENGGNEELTRDQDEQRRTLNDRVSVCAILTVNIPQIIATMVVLSHHWDDAPVCDEVHKMRWNWWSALSAIRMATYSAIIVYMVTFRRVLERRPDEWHHLNGIKNIVDAMGLVWFVVGNMWLFADDDAQGCEHPDRSPVYRLCAIMLLINYIQICLPCIIAFAMIPVFCFCMPCLIRIIARLHGGRFAQTRGATEQDISSLPEIVIAQEHLCDGETSCPVCLSDLAVGESGRMLRCKHLFHKSCIDEWLVVNATCPTCRAPVIEGREGSDDGGNGDDSTANPLQERELELRVAQPTVDGSEPSGHGAENV